MPPIDLKALGTPFAEISKRSSVEVDLSKVAHAVAKAVADAPESGDENVAMATLTKAVGEIDEFLGGVTHDAATDRLYAPGTELAKRFEVEKAKAAPFPKKKPDGKHVFENEAGESTGGTESATAMRAPAKKAQQPAHDEDVGEPGMLLQEDEQTPQSTGQISTALRGKGKTRKAEEVAAETEKATGAETPVTDDYQYETRGAGRAKPPTPKEQEDAQYTAGSGVANDGPKDKDEYSNHEGGKPSDYDFGHDPGPSPAKGAQKTPGAAKKATAEKAQYDLDQQGAVDEVDRKKPDPTKTNAKDTYPQEVDELGKAIPGQNDQQSSFDEVDDRSQKGKAAKAKDADGGDDDGDEPEDSKEEVDEDEEETKKGTDDEPVEKGEVSWADDMAPRLTASPRSARLTKGERPLPAQRGTRKNIEKYDRARERMMSGGEERVTE